MDEYEKLIMETTNWQTECRVAVSKVLYGRLGIEKEKIDKYEGNGNEFKVLHGAPKKA